jgi:hypothetical protein
VRILGLESCGGDRRGDQRLERGVVDRRGRRGRAAPVDGDVEHGSDRVLGHVLVDRGVREPGQSVSRARDPHVRLDTGLPSGDLGEPSCDRLEGRSSRG